MGNAVWTGFSLEGQKGGGVVVPDSVAYCAVPIRTSLDPAASEGRRVGRPPHTACSLCKTYLSPVA